MKMNDKVLAAFLVSMGLFSSIQAMQYVATLSAGERDQLMTVASAPQAPDVPVDPSVAGSGGAAEGVQRLA